jgi:hypothetical protein
MRMKLPLRVKPGASCLLRDISTFFIAAYNCVSP